ncbi:MULTISPECIES: copper-binding protein [unclassified Burkholderia]|uniref:copper-binding protein n=1 Tax=unclassified Burkholderia TaxID=2613784 RepID=UPI0014202AF7|nr:MULTISPECIES: copper-binding protein [unclassified Burkholderia]NIE55421.1 copper-binding protein [Burkholderia sp. Ap-955]NIF08944.1 copper-binding protein [Burkholderia sp. Ax-1735]NIG01902.1 copper-binding protein [Burkholderia sp. Tr-849]
MTTCFQAAAAWLAMIVVAMPVVAGGDMSDMNMGGAKMSAPESALTDAEVKEIDAGRGRVALKHGALDNVGMPPMTMAFKVADAAMIRPLHVGDKVRVRVENVKGELTIVKLVKRP